MSRKATRTAEDPRNNFLALKLALALKNGDGDKFCEAYDKPSLSGLGFEELTWIKEQARKDASLPEMTLKARMGWYKDMVIPDFVRKLEDLSTRTPELDAELRRDMEEIAKEEKEFKESRETIRNVVGNMIGNPSPKNSDKNQNYKRKPMSDVKNETRQDFFKNYHDEEEFFTNELGMRKKEWVQVEMPTLPSSQVDDPISFNTLGGNSYIHDEELPVDLEGKTTSSSKSRRKQKKPTKEKSHSLCRQQIIHCGYFIMVCEINIKLKIFKNRILPLAASLQQAEPPKPQKDSAKEAREAKEAQERKAKEKEEKKEEMKRLEKEREKYQIPDWVLLEEEDKKNQEKTGKKATGKKAKKGKKGKGESNAKQNNKNQQNSTKKQNSVETTNGTAGISSSENPGKDQPIVSKPQKKERRHSIELIDERSLLYDDDDWATIGVKAAKPTDRRSVPARIEAPSSSAIPRRTPPRAPSPQRAPVSLRPEEDFPQLPSNRPVRQNTPELKVNSTQEWPGLPGPTSKGDAPKILPQPNRGVGTRYEQRQASKAARAVASLKAAEAAKEAARIEAEKAEAARREAARIEAAKEEAARQEAEQARIQAEAARLEAERAEAARLEAEKAEAARLAAENAKRKPRETDEVENILGDKMGLNFMVTHSDEELDFPEEEKVENPVQSKVTVQAEVTFGEANASWTDEDIEEKSPKESGKRSFNAEEIQQLLLKSAPVRTEEPTEYHRKIVQFHNTKYQKLLNKHKNGCSKTVIYSS
ncbi:Oidioi.mRNA.OKI2018_I69.PAR.g9314.t1.cds [Oikopleura dioica]|uniref:Oidioi.mRNA.OKI2018_I69.PAR.g9314.t1.cds n=1 Tax=Oikopleura dioica TaxID=34765 RepID=A0ABN7RSN3_OIKDI|nr:Oidioi.mRNA.OKI2018_I69.PAR.g9314.t1.cds [Oikopleura dioica]